MDINKVIQSLFAKAQSTHSEHEAQQAILKAHELMAKHGIQKLTTEDDVKYISQGCKHTGNRAFRRPLANMISSNFRVKFFLTNHQVTFFGREEDVQIAKETFEYTYAFVCRETGRLCREMKKNNMDSTGIVNSYALGFCNGLKEKLDTQSVALMVVTPPEVNERFEEMTKGFRKSKRRLSLTGYSKSVYEKGLQDGRTILNGRRLQDKTA